MLGHHSLFSLLMCSLGACSALVRILNLNPRSVSIKFFPRLLPPVFCLLFPASCLLPPAVRHFPQNQAVRWGGHAGGAAIFPGQHPLDFIGWELALADLH